MFLDDEMDRKTGKGKPRDLTNMSVDELSEYKSDLKAEIERVDANIASKSAHKDAIDNLFKKKE
tara:strand:+ start:10363 stop:10554 length:192 start_codon:yes stop_codon:yes gene_type:complete